MKKLILVMVCVSLVSLWVVPNSMAATEAEKRAAIDAGLANLALTQLANGSWFYDGSFGNTAATGASLLAFLEEKPDWALNHGGAAFPYDAVVASGLNYLFSQATQVAIAVEPTGNPDSNANGIGVKFVPGGTEQRDTYVTGLVIPAIVATGTPNALVTVGSQAGRTYSAVVQDTIDYFAFGQSDPATGSQRGGWRYWADYGNSDQSTTQWPVIAGLYASSWGISVPAFEKTELALWTDFIQNDSTGAAGYQSPFAPNGELNETGALLIEQAFLGWPTSDSRVQAALGYINAHWQESANSTWDGNFGHPYAMWAIYKGLELMLGLDSTGVITNLHLQGSAPLDPGDVWNWWEDYCEYLVNTQNANGTWTGYSYWPSALATPWYINILSATDIPDNPIPEPATMLLLGSGLAGLGAISRRRRKK